VNGVPGSTSQTKLGYNAGVGVSLFSRHSPGSISSHEYGEPGDDVHPADLRHMF
jgi:hypothetical protein